MPGACFICVDKYTLYKRSIPTDVRSYNSREESTTLVVSSFSFVVEKIAKES